MKADVCIDQACKKPELETKGECFTCKTPKGKFKKRFKKFRVADKSPYKRATWRYFRKKRKFFNKKGDQKGGRCFICHKKDIMQRIVLKIKGGSFNFKNYVSIKDSYS